MTCKGNEEQINHYLDGELNPSEQVRFEQHLAGCPACQRELAQTRALFAVLDNLQTAPVPAGFGEQVLARLDRRPPSPLLRWILVAQVTVTLVLLVLAYPRLASWYGQASTRFAPGWLSNLVAGVAAWGQSAWAWLASTLTVEVKLTWPQGFGLTWPQAALLALALVGLWALGNRLLLTTKPNQRGGIT